jgi:hypothetical protein
MSRYAQGFNPYTGPLTLPKHERMESAKQEYVAGSEKVTAAKPFPRVFDLWATALKLAVAEELEPPGGEKLDVRRFHDNIGVLISGDIPLMALIATVAVRHRYRYEGMPFEEAIQILDEPSAQVQTANRYAFVGATRLLEILARQSTAPGPAVTRHFQKLAQPQLLATGP